MTYLRMTIIGLIGLTLVALATGAKADKVSEMLEPTAMVETKTGAGSATAFYVDKVRGTFLITAYHVVKGSSTSITVKFYSTEEKHTAFLYSYDEEEDIAILLTPYKHGSIVTLGYAVEVKLFADAYCVGNGLNHGIVPSKGIISGVDHEREGRLLYRSDCNIIFGYSGGGMYVQRGNIWVYVGTPDFIYSVPGGMFSPGHPVPFMGLMTRIGDIRAHLKEYNIPDGAIEQDKVVLSPRPVTDGPH